MHHRPVGHDRDGVARADHSGLTDGDGVMALGHLAHRMTGPGLGGLLRIAIEGAVVHALGLKEYDRVVVLDRGDQHALRVVRVRRHDDLQAAHMREHPLRALGVRLAATDATATGRTDGDGRGKRGRAAVTHAGELAHDLVVGGIDVVGELDLCDGAQTVGRHADRGTDDAALSDGGIDDAMRTIAALQPLGGSEHAAEVADIFAQDHDPGIAREHDLHRGVERLHHAHRGHVAAPASRAAASSASSSARCASRWGGSTLKTSSNISAGSSLAPSLFVP